MRKYYNIGLFVGLFAGIVTANAYRAGTPVWIFAIGLAVSVIIISWIVNNLIENEDL